jgi:C-terminal processing protease CtpA/Prc
MNGLSGSGSVVFSGIFAKKQWGEILGEPCLGPVTGTWGNPVPVQLENTGVAVFIASMRFNVDNTFTVDPKPVKPTVFIYETPLDLYEERDASIEYIKKRKL